MKNNDINLFCLGVFVSSIFWVFITRVNFHYAVRAGMKEIRQEAVLNGLAKYVADDNGNPLFVWEKK